MFVVTHGQRGSERFEWQSVHKVGEMWEQHKDAMEWPYWFMEGKIVRDPAGQLGQDRWWAGGTPRRTVFSHSIVRGTVRRAESHLIPEASAPNPAFPWWPARVAPCSAGPAVWIVCPGSRPSAPSTPRVFNASYRRACRRVSCECAERAYLKQSLPTPGLESGFFVGSPLFVTDEGHSHVGLIFADAEREGKNALAHRACGVLDSTQIGRASTPALPPPRADASSARTAQPF